MLAVLVGVSASLREGQEIAGERTNDFAIATKRSAPSQRLKTPRMTASAGTLAYYDEAGNWIDEPCSICDVPPVYEQYYYEPAWAPGEVFYQSDPVIIDTYYHPLLGEIEVYYGGAPDPYYFDEVPVAGDETEYWGQQYEMYERPDYEYGYGTQPEQVYDVYIEDEPYYTDIYYVEDDYRQDYQQTYQPTWYERMFPGIGQSIVPLLPPVMRPQTYSQPAYAPYAPPRPYTPPSRPYTPPPALPDCSITVAPQSVQYGGSVLVSWVSRNATRASLNDAGSVALSGSRTYPGMIASRTFGLTVTGPGGTNACYTTLSVQPQTPLPSCSISAHPQEIERGASTNLAWVSQNATYAVLANVGTVPLSNGRTVTPSQTTNYFLTVYSENGKTGSCSTTVLVR